MKRPFDVDLKQMARWLSTRHYSTQDVVIRELVQNAYDAIQLRFRRRKGDGRITLRADPSAYTLAIADNGKGDGRITLRADPSAYTLAIADNGIGMDEDDLTQFLSTLWRGVKQFQDADRDEL